MTRAHGAPRKGVSRQQPAPSRSLAAAALAVCLAVAGPSGALADGPRVLVRIDHLDTGDLEAAGFMLAEPQMVRIQAVDLEARDDSGELVAAWILEGKSRRVVWRMGESEPSYRNRGLRHYDEPLDLPAGLYEVYFATQGEEWEPSHDEEIVDQLRRAARRAKLRLQGWKSYDEAVEDLKIVVRGRGESLDEDDLEDFHDTLREAAVLSLEADGDDLSLDGAFELEAPAVVELYVLGEASKKGVYDFGWLVNTTTREKIWKLSFEESSWAGGSSRNRLVRKELDLPAGRYAAYFHTDDSHSPAAWSLLPPRDPAFWGLTVWARRPGARAVVRTVEHHDLPEESIAELIRMGNHQYRSALVRIREPQNVRIFALGEGVPAGMVDYGWIVDTRKGKKVWVMDYAHTSHAGGAKKNRLADEVIHLPAGDYVVHFKTDGSHSYPEWNAKEPVFPERWGISLFPTGATPRASFEAGWDDLRDLARIERVGDDQHHRRSFRLDAPTLVYVRALGESYHGELYDYGWIENSTGGVVWTMTYPETQPGGGADKNRAFRGTLQLPAGEYVLCYKSDDSHSYADWNDKPPSEPEAWGIRVSVLTERP